LKLEDYRAAFQDARSAFEQQKAREAGAAAAIGRAGAETFKSGLAEQGALQAVGEQRRDLAQSALDEEYFKFLEEREFPQQRLAEYSGFVYGNPLTSFAHYNQPIQLAHRSNLALADNCLVLVLLLAAPSLVVLPVLIYLLKEYQRIFSKTGGGLSDLMKRKERWRLS
jgi:hypothetical protein